MCVFLLYNPWFVWKKACSLRLGGEDIFEVEPEEPCVVCRPLCVEDCVAVDLDDRGPALEPEEAAGRGAGALPEGVYQRLVERPPPLELHNRVLCVQWRLPCDVREHQAEVILCDREFVYTFNELDHALCGCAYVMCECKIYIFIYVIVCAT